MVSVRRHWLAFTLAALALVYLILLAVIRREPDRGPTEIYFADRITDAHGVLIDRYNRVHEGQVRVVPIRGYMITMATLAYSATIET